MILDAFFKRQRRLRDEVPDVYTYNELPKAFRVQLSFILKEKLEYEDWEHIGKASAREIGVFSLNEDDRSTVFDRSYQFVNSGIKFLTSEENIDHVLSFIEIAFCLIRENEIKNNTKTGSSVINELNTRFQEHSIGFQFRYPNIIRVDSEYIHNEIVKPALTLLHQKEFKTAEEEFLTAHEHYRKGKTQEALNKCLKSFESMMKAICKKRKWKIPDKVTASNLIDIVFTNELIAPSLQSYFTSLISLLESSGVVAARNRMSAHYQNSDVIEVPPYLAAHILHQTAAILVSLGEADQAFKKGNLITRTTTTFLGDISNRT